MATPKKTVKKAVSPKPKPKPKATVKKATPAPKKTSSGNKTFDNAIKNALKKGKPK